MGISPWLSWVLPAETPRMRGSPPVSDRMCSLEPGLLRSTRLGPARRRGVGAEQVPGCSRRRGCLTRELPSSQKNGPFIVHIVVATAMLALRVGVRLETVLSAVVLALLASAVSRRLTVTDPYQTPEIAEDPSNRRGCRRRRAASAARPTDLCSPRPSEAQHPGNRDFLVLGSRIGAETGNDQNRGRAASYPRVGYGQRHRELHGLPRTR